MPRPKCIRIPRTCEHCGQSFSVIPYLVKSGRGRFCSRECRDRAGTTPIEERFRKYVGQPTETGCIPWTGHIDKYGYGTIKDRESRLSIGAHRVSYMIKYGSIPDGLCVLHSCDNRKCVNYDHLFVGTDSDNMADMKAKGRDRKAIGEESGTAKLTEDKVKEIRTKFATGKFSQYELACEYKFSQSGISKIIIRKTWKHI